MLQTLTKRVWLYVLYALGVALLIVLVTQWSDWGWDRRLLAFTFLVLPFHVFEEWVWPAGFHVQYNLTMGTDQVDRYPMSRLTDSITNFAAMIFGLVLIAIGGTPAVVGMMIFCLLEVIVHTFFGVRMLRQFRGDGKRSIYGPGSASAYLGFLPVGIGMIIYLSSIETSVLDWVGGVGVVALMLVSIVVIPEGLLKKKGNAYPFASAGYFTRFAHSATCSLAHPGH